MAACASRPGDAVPEKLAERAEVPGFPGIRKWGLDFALDTRDAAATAARENRALTILAISGGGADGAFGAGLICGWSAAGDRPAFDVVTGISTGALMAPYVFLGSEYDAELKRFYTTTTGYDIYRARGFLPSPWRDSIVGTGPLKKTVAKQFDAAFLSAVAREHLKGRRLYVGTTNLDAGRAVIWDMGAIAASGRPEAADLFHHVVVASASIPVAFPPVYIAVEAEGKPYMEMHVDGGVTTQVFIEGGVPVGLSIDGAPPDSAPRDGARSGPARPRPRVYLIRNAKILPKAQEVEPDLLAIAGRAVSTLIRTQGVGDIYRTYLQSVRDGYEFHLATIPLDFDEKREEEFDPKFMTALFERGFALARGGYPWERTPPSAESMAKSASSPAR